MVTANNVFQLLGAGSCPKNMTISKPCSLNNVINKGLVFANIFSEEILKKLNNYKNILAIVTKEYSGKLKCLYIIADNPRYEFARVVNKFFIEETPVKISKTATIGEKVSLGEKVNIGEYTVIGKNVTIGDFTMIRNHVVINDNTVIGSNCLIKSHAVIGEEGFGFDSDKERFPIRMPHLGSVEIGNNVEIGVFCSIARGVLDKTIIKDFVKIDDHVYIAHNVVIGEKTLVTGCAEISGSVTIGTDVWIGPNSSIRQNITIHDQSLVGIGAVVVKNISSNSVVAYNPARHVKNRFNTR